MGYYLITTAAPPGIQLQSLIVQANNKADIINNLTTPAITVFAIIEFTEEEVKQFRSSIDILDWRRGGLNKIECNELTASQIEEVHELIKDADEHLKQFNMMVDKFWGIE